MGEEFTYKNLKKIFSTVPYKAILAGETGFVVYAHKFIDPSSETSAAANLVSIMNAYETCGKDLYASISESESNPDIQEDRLFMEKTTRITIHTKSGNYFIGVRVNDSLYLGVHTCDSNIGSIRVLLDGLSNKINNVYF